MLSTATSISWPPAYKTRRSKRAKSILLQVSYHKGLEIIVPETMPTPDIEGVLLKNKRWIEKQLSQHGARKAIQQDAGLPHFIELRACQQTWSVYYEPLAGAGVRINQLNTACTYPQLRIKGNVVDDGIVIAVLRRWLARVAKQQLTPWLNRLSEETGLYCERISIRGQKHRWGSCSANKAITLNYKLLFLPPYLVEHILLHELCHLRHLNHSKRFWALLTRFDSACHVHRRAMKQADCYLPHWLEA